VADHYSLRLEINDAWLADLVNRAEAGEDIVDTFESVQTSATGEGDSTARKIEALAEIICRAGDESTACTFSADGNP
jgi:alkyl hydroperoxide reductase subunit AhpF